MPPFFQHSTHSKGRDISCPYSRKSARFQTAVYRLLGDVGQPEHDPQEGADSPEHRSCDQESELVHTHAHERSVGIGLVEFLRTREGLAQHVEPVGHEGDVVLAGQALTTLEDDEALAVGRDLVVREDAPGDGDAALVGRQSATCQRFRSSGPE